MVTLDSSFFFPLLSHNNVFIKKLCCYYVLQSMSSCNCSLTFVCKADCWSTPHSVWYEVYRCHTTAPNLWCEIDLFLLQSQSPNDCWPTKLLMLFLKNETHHNLSKYCFVKSHRSWYSSLKIHHAGGTQLLRLTHIHISLTTDHSRLAVTTNNYTYMHIYVYTYTQKNTKTHTHAHKHSHTLYSPQTYWYNHIVWRQERLHDPSYIADDL